VPADAVKVPPEKLQSLTVTIPEALTHIFPISPLANPAGQPGATASPTDAPVSGKD
jgi:hypothetical protein